MSLCFSINLYFKKNKHLTSIPKGSLILFLYLKDSILDMEMLNVNLKTCKTSQYFISDLPSEH